MFLHHPEHNDMQDKVKENEQSGTEDNASMPTDAGISQTGSPGPSAEKPAEAVRIDTDIYKTIVNKSPEGIYICQDRILRFCNPRFAELFGFDSPEKALGMKVKELVSPKSRNLVDDELRKREKDKIQLSHYNFFARRLDGSEFEVETFAGSITYKGKPAIQGAMRDVSAQRQIERQLRQAQKMEAIGTLAGGIAHDFNNILSVIIGYTELSSDGSSEAKTKRNLSQVLKASHRAKELVSQILSFSRQTEKDRRPIAVAPVVKEVLILIRASLPSTIKIRQDISATNYVISADASQLHQVLMNLCTNASHAMQETGGTLEVILSDLNRDLELIDEKNMAPAPYCRLTVKDTGTGMDSNTLERIFDPFFTTKKTGEGTGLGLSVVHGIVRSLDGEISVESEPGKGTAFHLFLPLLQENIKPKAPPTTTTPTGHETILLVDDEAPLVMMAERMLQRLGYKVTAETESLKAMDTFGKTPDEFDLVITDLTMPDMTGKQLAAKILELRPDTPIILSTGFNRGFDRDQIRGFGFKELLMKPYTKKEIAIVVRKVLDDSK
ncbi:MAG: response regulator [bacterium]|nr:response regulator [bacterium]